MCREACDNGHAKTRMPAKEAYYREVTSVTLYGSIFIANNDDGVVVGVTAGFHGDAQFAVIGGFPADFGDESIPAFRGHNDGARGDAGR